MKYYCGLDVSLNNTAICVVNHDGDIIRESEVPTEPAAIDQWLKATGFPMERVGLEAGGLTPWLCHELLAAGLARHLHRDPACQGCDAGPAGEDRPQRRARSGAYHAHRLVREVHVKSHESQKLRVLLGNRRCLLDKRLDIDSQIRGTLKVFGHKTGKVTPAKYEQRIRELVQDDQELQAYIFPMLEVRRHLIQQCNVLEKMILDCVKKDEICGLFMTIPGVGPLTALAFKTCVDRPERFRHSKAVGAAVG